MKQKKGGKAYKRENILTSMTNTLAQNSTSLQAYYQYRNPSCLEVSTHLMQLS